MGVTHWITEHWLDFLQSVGIVSSFLFTAYSIRKEEQSRQIGNLLAIGQQHRAIWKELYQRPELSRILENKAKLRKAPVTNEERLFVTFVILHLDTVHRAMKAGMFVKLEGLKKDVKGFFSLPIPKIVWENSKPLQGEEFVRFVESSWLE